ncbi:hypothetical protein XENTR_v10001770 [Xenopus tropicalis]|nr:hypothetical protein XENTR_v10001770 [Xenopus tropicalis]
MKGNFRSENLVAKKDSFFFVKVGFSLTCMKIKKGMFVLIHIAGAPSGCFSSACRYLQGHLLVNNVEAELPKALS